MIRVNLPALVMRLRKGTDMRSLRNGWTLFWLLGLTVLLLASCGGGSSETDSGDADQPALTDGDADVDELTLLCFAFCERLYECDESGGIAEEDLIDCRGVCESLPETCITRPLLECAELRRCDEFSTCWLQREEDTDCEFPIDREVDGDGVPHAEIQLPERVSFGAVVLGQSSERSLTIGNAGNLILEVYDLHVVDHAEEFLIDLTPGDTLRIRPGESQDVRITYSPSDGGDDQASLLVYSNDPTLRVAEVLLDSDYKGVANIETDPAALEFDTTEVGAESAPLQIVIRNRPGSSDDNRLLTVYDLDIVGTSGGDFSLTPSSPQPPFSIAPNQSRIVAVIFSPQRWGETADTLTIQSDSQDEADQTLSVALSGYGAARTLCINPDPVQFGTVKVGTESLRPVQLEACGESPVTISGFMLDETDGPFSLLNPPALPAEGQTLAVGDYLELMIRYAPTAQLGIESTQLRVNSNDLFFPDRDIAIRGEGAISNLTVSPTVLQFGDVGVGESPELNVTLRNAGGWPVDVLEADFAMADSPYRIVDEAGLFPFTLAGGGGERQFTLAFEPEEEGSIIDRLIIESDNSAGSVELGLSGRGTAATLEISETDALTFGDVQLGSSKTITLTVTNTGRAALTLEELGITQGSSSFSVDPTAVADPLPWNSSLDLDIVFTPDSTGTIDGLFYLDSNDTRPEWRHVEVSLTGTGIDPVLDISPATPYEFESTFIGGSRGPVVLTVKNSGEGPLLLSSISPDPGFASAFLAVLPETPLPALLRPFDSSGDHYDILVSFVPSSADDFEETLRIESNDLDRSPFVFTLRGEAQACPSGFYNCDDNPNDCETPCSGHPNDDEICNGLDDNCNCAVDEGFILGEFCQGEGQCPVGVTECNSTDPGELLCSTNPGGSEYVANAEACNNLDEDCDGLTDEDFSVGESCNGVGECGSGVYECRNAFAARCSTDRGGSQDQSQDELCDNLDNDCDGLTDETFGLGLTCSGEGVCRDGVWECASETTVRCSTLPDGSEYDGAPEVCDGNDNDCDGSVDEDWQIGQPCDGVGDCGIGLWECASLNSRRCSTDIGGSNSQSRPELCDGSDNDCDSAIDEDFQIDEPCTGTGECGSGLWECASLVARLCSSDPGGSTHVARQELCDGLDNDCDGFTDENFGIGGLCVGEGVCGTGMLECANEFSTRCSTEEGGSEYEGSPEQCDDLDNDCDGSTDEDFPLGAACDGVGACGVGVYECDGMGDDRCSTDIGGSAYDGSHELCDGTDNNCDGAVDEGYGVNPPEICNGTGACATAEGIWLCTAEGGHICSVNEPEHPTYSGNDETCDGQDNDCDGQTDEICRTNVYRFEREVIPGFDLDHRLSADPSPPSGFTLDTAAAPLVLYTEAQPGLAAFVELTNTTTTDTVYSANAQTISDYLALGYIQGPILGYLALTSGDPESTPLYQMVNPDLTDHIYTTSDLELSQLSSNGYIFEDVVGWVWE